MTDSASPPDLEKAVQEWLGSATSLEQSIRERDFRAFRHAMRAHTRMFKHLQKLLSEGDGVDAIDDELRHQATQTAANWDGMLAQLNTWRDDTNARLQLAVKTKRNDRKLSRAYGGNGPVQGRNVSITAGAKRHG